MNEADFIRALLDTPSAREILREIVREEVASYMAYVQPPLEEELTLAEVAKLKKVSKRTVYDWVEKNIVTFKRTPGGQLRFTRKDVENM